MRLVFLSLCALPVFAAAPLTCPAGAPLGRFDLTVSSPVNTPPLPLESINRLLPGYKISYRPQHLNALDKKKARLSLLLVPAEGNKITITDPKPADEPIEWTVPFRTQIVSLVWGPAGLNKGKVSHLVTKDDELIGQLADYAAKVQETQSLLSSITEQQAMDPTQNVGAAVAGFASAYPGAPKLDRTAPTNEQMLTFINGVNPALSAYDPLTPNPQQRAAQTAGLAAAVAGLFFGNGVGLAAGSGAVLVNMHSLFFPNTELRSALAQKSPDSADTMSLCGNKNPSASRTELAFLWADRVPDSTAPEISLPKTEHLPIGIKSSVPIEVKGVKDAKLAARADHWKLVSASNGTSVQVPAKVSADGKTVDLTIEDPKLSAGQWKLAADWDWDPLNVSGDVELHRFSTFDTARLTPDSQDHLVENGSQQLIHLNGTDFEFVQNLSWKKTGDPFAKPTTLPFRLPDQKDHGPASSLETQLDPKQLGAGDYVFVLAQNDGKDHEVPFKVLPAKPAITNLPLIAHTGQATQTIELRGTNLDRIENVSASDSAVSAIKLESPDKLTVTLDPSAAAGKHVTLNVSVKDTAEPMVLTDGLQIAGPKAAITAIRKSIPGDLGIALNADEIPDGVSATFAITVANAAKVDGIELSCEGSPAVKIANGETTDVGRMRQESADALFLSLNPQKAGRSGCSLSATLLTPDGPSEPHKVGMIMHLPKIDSFRLTDEKSGDAGYVAQLTGKDLELIEKAGWTAESGVSIDAIPSPDATDPGKESLRIVVPWPAPSPHAPLYIWLRGEQNARLTSSKY